MSMKNRIDNVVRLNTFYISKKKPPDCEFCTNACEIRRKDFYCSDFTDAPHEQPIEKTGRGKKETPPDSA